MISLHSLKKLEWSLFAIGVCFLLLLGGNTWINRQIEVQYRTINKASNHFFLKEVTEQEFLASWDTFQNSFFIHIKNRLTNFDENRDLWEISRQKVVVFVQNQTDFVSLFSYKDSLYEIMMHYQMEMPELEMERLRLQMNRFISAAFQKDSSGVINQYPAVYGIFNHMLPMLRKTEALQIGILLDEIYTQCLRNRIEGIDQKAVGLQDVFYQQYFTFSSVRNL